MGVQEHYESVTMWYGVPAQTLVLTDYFGFSGSGPSQHNYQATSPTRYNITSRFELGVDHLNGNASLPEVFAATTMAASMHRGESSFDVQLVAKNRGCMLRRTLDLASANQKAFVSVRSAATRGEWADAGTFFTAGS